MIVFTIQFGCLKIRDSLVDFRVHRPWKVNLRTGVDKEDCFRWEDTKYQVVTYGMLWHWLVKGGQETRRNLLDQNCAFLLDEFSGKAAGGDPLELAADPQTMEIAILLARFARENSGTHRLLVTGASLDRHFMNAVLPGAELMAFTGRMYPLERCIISPRDMGEILTLCAQLICITIEKDSGNILVFLPGMDDILRLDTLVKQKLGRLAASVNIVRLLSHLLGERGDQPGERGDLIGWGGPAVVPQQSHRRSRSDAARHRIRLHPSLQSHDVSASVGAGDSG